jgi:hypothetical protein
MKEAFLLCVRENQNFFLRNGFPPYRMLMVGPLGTHLTMGLAWITSDTQGCISYMIEALWLNAWQNFVN